MLASSSPETIVQNAHEIHASSGVMLAVYFASPPGRIVSAPVISMLLISTPSVPCGILSGVSVPSLNTSTRLPVNFPSTFSVPLTWIEPRFVSVLDAGTVRVTSEYMNIAVFSGTVIDRSSVISPVTFTVFAPDLSASSSSAEFAASANREK